MEKTAVMGIKSAVDRKGSVGCAAAILLLCGAPAWAATQAGGQPGEAVVAEAKIEQPVRVQVDATSLPRIEGQDSGFQGPRVDVSLFPATTPRLGAVFGMSGFGPQHSPTLGLQANRPSVDLGLRYSHRVHSQQIDVTAWRRMNAEPEPYTVPDRQAVYGARVEMNLAPAKSGLALARGFVGFQLESGARISIKRKDGRPMIYYRTSF